MLAEVLIEWEVGAYVFYYEDREETLPMKFSSHKDAMEFFQMSSAIKATRRVADDQEGERYFIHYEKP